LGKEREGRKGEGKNVTISIASPSFIGESLLIRGKGGKEKVEKSKKPSLREGKKKKERERDSISRIWENPALFPY